MTNALKTKTAALLLAAMMLPLASCGDKGGDTGDKPTPAETAAAETSAQPEEEIVIPEKYSLVDEGKVTEIKRQQGSGMCWAYATTAAAESSLIVNGFEDNTVDLSEAHIGYVMYPFAEDRAENSPEDGFYILGEKKNAKTTPYYLGGNSYYVAFQFANGAGPVYEDEAPLVTGAGELIKSADNIYKLEKDGKLKRYMGRYLLTDLKIYSSDEDIKKAILSSGSVITSVYTGAEYRDNQSTDANDGNVTYYANDKDNNEGITDHVFNIVGWDDNYPKDNFKITPKDDGAWLVKDSGVGPGEKGYVWMSYDEYHPDNFSFVFCRREDYGEILTYDHLAPTDIIKTAGDSTTIANVFKADKANKIKGIGIYYFIPDQKVNISIYKNPENGKPDSGEKVYDKDVVMGSGNGNINGETAYSVAAIDDGVAVDSGDTFSVVLRYTNDKDINMGAPVEGSELPRNMEYMVEYYVTSNEGESYALSGDTWYDLSKSESSAVFGKTGTINNACIKALMAE